MDKDAGNGQAEEFKNFEELTKRLLAVPKEDLDKKRAERRREKKATDKPAR